MIGRKINVRLSDGAELPRYAHEGDAGLDLRITHDVTLEPGCVLPLARVLRLRFRKGAWGLVFPRSGLASKHGITLSNSVGVIDSGYRGEIGATLLNQSDETTTLDAGTRVCQLIVMPFVPCELVPCEELTETERGAAGFGSTGIA